MRLRVRRGTRSEVKSGKVEYQQEHVFQRDVRRERLRKTE